MSIVTLSTEGRTALLASIVDSSDDAIIGKTPEGIITSWNHGAEVIYGYSSSEIIGKPMSMLIQPDRPDEMEGILARIRNGERVEHYETVRLRKDGKSIAIALTVSPIYDSAGKLIGASSIARDITERARADEKLRAASLYARSLVEASLDPLVTISPQGKITDVNEATIKVTGIEREKLIGTDFSDYFTEPEKAREGYQQVFSKGSVTDYPLTIRHKDGRLTDVLYNASVYKDDRHEVLGVFAAARDITGARRRRKNSEACSKPPRTLSSLSTRMGGSSWSTRRPRNCSVTSARNCSISRSKYSFPNASATPTPDTGPASSASRAHVPWAPASSCTASARTEANSRWRSA